MDLITCEIRFAEEDESSAESGAAGGNALDNLW